jgi:hypothetical protein
MFYNNFLFRVSGKKNIEKHPTVAIAVKRIIGFSFVSDNDVSINWPHAFAIAPKVDVIPMPSPLKG